MERVGACSRPDNGLPQHAHVLIPGTCDCVILGGTRNICRCDYVKDLVMEKVSWIIEGGPM